MRTTYLFPGLVVVLLLGSAVPALAQSPPGTIAPAPTAPAPPAGSAGTADSDGPGRDGLFVTASLGVGGDLQLGWMLAPWMGVFVASGGYEAENVVLPNGTVQPMNVSLESAGIRLASGVGFAEVRIASLTATNACEFDDPCYHREMTAAILGAGLELIHTRHFGLHLQTQIVIDGQDVVPLLELGVGFYL